MDLLKVTIVLLRVNGWFMLFYAIHGATYPIQRLVGLLQRGEAEYMSLSGFFAPDVIRFAMYVVAAFVLIKYSRILAWLFCRDLLESRPSTTASREDAPHPTPPL
jgi:hypothetical protein